MSDKKLDADDVEKEEELMFGYGGSSKEPVELLGDYLPENQDFAAKTVLTSEQVHLLGNLEQLTTFFEEVDEYDEVIQEWIEAYEKRQTSVRGLSRNEFVEILVSLNGGSVDSESSKGMLEKVLDADTGDSND